MKHILLNKEIIHAFIKCKTKAHFLIRGKAEKQNEFNEWQQQIFEKYRQGVSESLHLKYNHKIISNPIQIKECLTNKYSLILDCKIERKGTITHIDALERSTLRGSSKRGVFIPIRFVPNERVSKDDKIMLAFDAIALSVLTDHLTSFGKIIHGKAQKSIRVDLKRLIIVARTILKEISDLLVCETPPALILNTHCMECNFRLSCRKNAIEKDELSLLSGLKEKERKKYHSRGIFTTTQLSYTFRPRKPPKKAKTKGVKHYQSLRALAIRNNHIYITGNPELNLTGTLVYLDVEGVPDLSFYYLIGLRTKQSGTLIQHSFWADDISEEEKIWRQFVHVLSSIEDPKIIYYGAFEARFLKRMKARYRVSNNELDIIEKMISESQNLLSVIYGRIYFPTYSNGLKSLANYLGFKWSDPDASGLKSLMWRGKWEATKDNIWKEKLLTYNTEDCVALEMLTDVVIQLRAKENIAVASNAGAEVIHTDNLKRESPHNWGKNEFVLPELEYINRCSYWDYQRNKIYIKSNSHLKSIAKKKHRKKQKRLPINKTVEATRHWRCPKCNSATISRWGHHSKLLYDLKISHSGIKRWIVNFRTVHYQCSTCGITFPSDKWDYTRHRYGHGFLSYVIYNNIGLSIPQAEIARSITQLFGYPFNQPLISKTKTRSAEYYLGTYQAIKEKLVKGTLIHVDETKANVGGKSAYAWVFTSLEEIMFVYSETREGEIIQNLLKDFHGVLVSDFYTAYDSIDCPQQKCLIHLIRDFNNAILDEPFNEDLKELVQRFADLLKPIIATVDRFGLKKYHLGKHKNDIKNFFKYLDRNTFRTETAIKFKKRLKKYQEKLFMFTNYDGVSWNNNNAEHGIKAFARMRRVIGGSSNEKGIREYLILLSISETCRYKGISFLEFLQSGEKNIDEFIKKHHRK